MLDFVIEHIHLTMFIPNDSEISIIINLAPTLFLIFAYAFWLLYINNKIYSIAILLILSSIVSFPIPIIMYYHRWLYWYLKTFYGNYWWCHAHYYWLLAFFAIIFLSIICNYSNPMIKKQHKVIVIGIAIIASFITFWCILSGYIASDNMGDLFYG